MYIPHLPQCSWLILATIILISQVTKLRHVKFKKNVHVIQWPNGEPEELNPIWIERLLFFTKLTAASTTGDIF